LPIIIINAAIICGVIGLGNVIRNGSGKWGSDKAIWDRSDKYFKPYGLYGIRFIIPSGISCESPKAIFAFKKGIIG